MSKYIYMRDQDEKKNFLDKNMRDTIYQMFSEYENWKQSIGAYDMMDLVNYILGQIRYCNYQFPPIHYMMIDEVQDLPHAVLLLFIKITEQGLFFAGDTAQTIAQGVGFRFCDMRSVFDNRYFQENKNFYSYTYQQSRNEVQFMKPIVKQLTVNFRSHNNILQLANSVVTCLEIFFPKTIDRLKKEKSNLDGPKPILLNDTSPELLFFILSGEEQYRETVNKLDKNEYIQYKEFFNKNPLEFGCNQVIIVRDQEAKERLPKVLSHALCLTIYEAKGLEFDDVILYNFFSDSTLDTQKWALLNSLHKETVWVDKKDYLEGITVHKWKDFDPESKENQENVGTLGEDGETPQNYQETPMGDDIETPMGDDKNDEAKNKNLSKEQDEIMSVFNMEESEDKTKVKLKRVSCTKRVIKEKDFIQYSSLCIELKQLYVAITRPRNRLIIYDDQQEKREIIQQYWKFLDTVDFVSRDVMSNILGEKQEQPQQDLDLVQNEEPKNIFQSILTHTTQQEWKNQGLRMFKHKYYEQAIKCFSRAKEENLYNKAKSYLLADEGSKLIVKVEAEKQYLEQNQLQFKDMDKIQKKKVKLEFKNKQQAAYNMFTQAGEIFKQYEKFKQAAQCFFSAQNYIKAADIYMQIGQHKQAGEAYFLLKNYKKAADLYDKTGNYIRMIECYDILNDYEKILETIGKYSNTINAKEKEIFIRKYAPLAFQKLVQEIEQQNKADDGKEEKQNDQIEQIQEEDDESNDDSDEEEEDVKIEEKNESENENDNSNEVMKQDFDETETKQDKPEEYKQNLNKKEVSLSDIDFSQSQSIQKQTEKSVDLSQMSFENIDKMSSNKIIEVQSDKKSINLSDISFSVLEGEVNNDHLSQFDLEQDKWLMMDGGSVIQSIAMSRKGELKLGSEYSQVDPDQVFSPHMQLVNSKADIFIENKTMETIIKYISMFSDDFRKELNLQRSQKSMLSQQKVNQEDMNIFNDDDFDLIIDLDNIDIKFIYLILDTLEAFKIYKLSIFVCNRYRLSQRLGRYVVSLSHKYSELANCNSTIDNVYLIQGQKRQQLQEKAFIASVAIHNILENINPVFLKGKKENEEMTPQNSLGLECYRQLILLGYWKKTLFQIDYHNALDLASAFGDFQNFKFIFLAYSQKFKKIAPNRIPLISPTKADFLCLPFEKPETPREVDLTIICLEHYVQKFLLFRDIKTESQDYFTSKAYRAEIVQEEFDFLFEKQTIFPDSFLYSGLLINKFYQIQIENDNQFLSQERFIPFTKTLQRHEDSEYIKNFKEAFNHLLIILEQKIMFKSQLIDLRIFDLINFAVIYAFSAKDLQNDFLKYENNDFMMIINCYFKILGMLQECYKLNRFSTLIVRALFQPFNIRLINEGSVLKLINKNHVLVHRGSLIIGDLVNFKQQKQKELQKLIDTSRSVTEEVFFADIDHEYIACPIDIILAIIKQKLYNNVTTFISMKCGNLRQIPQPLLHSEYMDSTYNYAIILALQNVQQIMDINMSARVFENLSKKMLKNGPEYKKYGKNDILRKYMKIEAHKKERDPYSDDDELFAEMKQLGMKSIRYNRSQKKQWEKDLFNQKAKKQQQQQQTGKKSYYTEKQMLKKLLQSNIGTYNKKMHFWVRNTVIELAIFYLKKGLNDVKHKDIVKAKRLFAFAGEDWQFQEVCRIIRYSCPKQKLDPNVSILSVISFVSDNEFSQEKWYKNTYKAYRTLDDLFLLKKHGIIAEYDDCVFDYLQMKFRIIPIEEIISVLTQATVLNLISYDALQKAKKKKQLFISGNYLKHIPNVSFIEYIAENEEVDGYNKFTVKSNFTQMPDILIFDEILRWIKQIFDLQLSKTTQQVYKLIVLMLNLVINLDNMPKQLFESILELLNIMEPQKIKQFSDTKLIQQLFRVNSVQKLDEFKKKLYDSKNLQFSFDFTDNPKDDMCLLTIIDVANEQKSYDNYYAEQLQIDKMLAKRIQSRAKIANFNRKYNNKFGKIRSKMVQSPLINWSLVQKIGQYTCDQYLRNINFIAFNYSSIYEIFRKFEQIKRDIVNTYFQTYIENALDFHYITMFMSELADELENFQQTIQDTLQNLNQEKIKKLVQLFVILQKSLDKQSAGFNEWKIQNVKFEADVKKILNRNKKIISLKWAQRGGFNSLKVQKLQKKRAGLKKQKALQERKERIKIYK